MLPLNSRDSPLFHNLLSIQKSPAILFQPIIKMPYMTSPSKGWRGTYYATGTKTHGKGFEKTY